MTDPSTSNATNPEDSARVLEELLATLQLERIEENIFRGASQDLGWGRIFGGQVVGQALSAAAQTVPEDRQVHSLHSYFLRQGMADTPVVYTVDPIRDGRSFTTRRVVAIQGGRPIFNLAASFQIDEPGFDHQTHEAPQVPAPDGLLSEPELARLFFEQMPAEQQRAIPKLLRDRALAPRPIDVRPVVPLDPVAPPVRPPRRQVWFRASAPLPDAHWVHQWLMAYASDFHFLVTSMQPHGVSWLTPGMQVASLDHSLWFHRPFRFDEWVLYDIESPSAAGARGLVQGRFFTADGTHVATVAQEGLIRDRRGQKRGS